MGGVSIMLGFMVGVAALLAFNPPIDPFASAGIVTIILIFGVGVVDDITGMRQRFKPFLVAAAAIPLILTYGGEGSIWLPLIGNISFGLLYPLFLIPLAITTSANFANMMAGFNGLEAGVGVIGLGTLGSLSIITGHWEAGIIGLTLAAAFAAFLKYNWYPAKIFPGDSGTLLYGASIAIIGIMARLEFAAIMVSIPAAFDFTLKMLSKKPFAQRRDYGDTKVTADGVLRPALYPALSHAFLRVSNLNERSLVAVILAMESLYALIAVLLTLSLF
jgi:UDP-N-acetylglucosamine--dolichyl-phosphate N-acetylglucosaminephosphotransferase